MTKALGVLNGIAPVLLTREGQSVPTELVDIPESGDLPAAHGAVKDAGGDARLVDAGP